jgi:hypothetical protein
MSDEQDRAEAIDEDEVAAPFPPEQPLGVEDTDVPDSFAGRGVREEPEIGATSREGELIRPYAEDDLLDAEPQLVAEATTEAPDPESDGQEPSAEEAALHFEAEP